MVAEMIEENQIRSAPCPTCAICDSPGEFIYSRQRDRLFGADGVWNLKKCLNRHCGAIWLDPMPLPEDLWKAYASYYTHAAGNDYKPAAGKARPGPVRRIYEVIKHGHLANRFGYQLPSKSAVDRALGRLLYVFPARRADVEAQVRFLPYVPQGRLLDVGCGSGEWLLWMRKLGWQVQGVDFDEHAVQVAREQGLAVQVGSLEQQNFADHSFDAVTLNHVIEHVPDPVATLVECSRILKKGGKLFLATPNSSSLGHRLFKQDWRGLEPPRHLHIFDPGSMTKLLNAAGFGVRARIRTFNSNYIWRHSLQLRAAGSGTPAGPGPGQSRKIATNLLTLLEQGLLVAFPNAGEWLAVEAFKT